MGGGTRLGDDQAAAAVLVIDGHVEARAEEVLVVRGQHVGQHQRAEARVVAVLRRCQRRGHLAGQLHLVLDRAVLAEVPVETVLVVGCAHTQPVCANPDSALVYAYPQHVSLCYRSGSHALIHALPCDSKSGACTHTYHAPSADSLHLAAEACMGSWDWTRVGEVGTLLWLRNLGGWKEAVLTNGGDERYDKLPAAAHFRVHVAQFGVFPDDPCVLLMDADGLLDDIWLACAASLLSTLSFRSHCDQTSLDSINEAMRTPSSGQKSPIKVR